ncbi:MAG TPA: hypothetical protein VM054_07075 [bacterium]|nr:hypothetical protein [bacterium]
MRLLPLFVVLSLALLALAGCNAEKEEPAAEAGLGTEQGPAETTAAGDEGMPDAYTGHFVYVTEHGDRYHAPYCPHVRGKDNLRRMTREDAVLEGYEPCKDCNPGPPR